MRFFCDQNWRKIDAINHTNHILLPLIIPMYQSQHLFYGDLIFIMEDKAPAHTAGHTQAGHAAYGIVSLAWPVSSSDLNPIEEGWRRMKKKLYRMEERPTTVPTMHGAVEEAWRSITNKEIGKIVDTMPARIRAVIAAGGGHTHY